MLTPVIGHPTCDLDRQRRLIESRRASLARALASRPGLLARLFGRADRPRSNFAADLRTGSEDVWHALRF